MTTPRLPFILAILCFLLPGCTEANEPAANGPLPSLTAPRPSGDSAAPPAKHTTTEPIDESVEIERLAPASEVPEVPPPSFSGPIAAQPLDDLPEIDADAGKAKPAPRDSKAADSPRRPADGKPGLAVIPFELKGQINEADAGAILADLLLSEIDSKAYRLFERSQLKALLTEQKFQESDLVSDAAKAAKFGKLAGIRYLVIGSLSRLGTEYHLSARVVDCETAEIGERGRVKFGSINDAADSLPELVNLLALRAGGEAVKPDPDKPQRQPGRPITGIDLIDAENPDASFKVTVRTGENKTDYVEKETISFIVEADRDCFVTLITRDSQGDMSLLLPNAWQMRAFVQKGKSVTIPAPEAGFRFPIKPPHGKTIIKAIATVRPLQLSGISAAAINKEKFVELKKGTKAIGLEGDAAKVQNNEGGNLHDLLKTDQWATATLVITTDDGFRLVRPAPPVPPPPSPEQPVTRPPGGRDPNDMIRERWETIVRAEQARASSGAAMSSNTAQPIEAGEEGVIRELLVFRRSAQAKNLGGPASMLEDMQVVPVGGEGIKAIGGIELSERIRLIKQGDAGVVAVVPNREIRMYAPPQTHLLSTQWALQSDVNPGVDLNWVRTASRASQIQPVLIGVVDQGIHASDNRLSQAIWTNPKDVPGNGIDDDGNGLIDDIHGWDFVQNVPALFHPKASFNHGTYCSSIIAARPSGGRGDVIGVAPKALIISAVALMNDPTDPKKFGRGSTKSILAAIAYVASHGAKVVNLSLGSSMSAKEIEEINNIPLWDNLEKQGVLLVIAAGNENNNNDEKPAFPASLPRSNVIAVMAVDPAGQQARGYDADKKAWVPFSNYGGRSVHLAAPGSLVVGIPSAGSTSIGDGTSYAAPMVTAAAALVWGQNPTWDYKQVKQAILKATKPLPGLKGLCQTEGILDLDQLLSKSR